MIFWNAFVFLFSVACGFHLKHERVNLAESKTYPIYTVNGSHYDIGYQVGKLAASRINEYISNYPGIDQMRHYILTGGAVDFRDLVNYNMEVYPQYFQELQGYSEGSGAQYTDILLLTFESEIQQLMPNYTLSNFTKPISKGIDKNFVILFFSF